MNNLPSPIVPENCNLGDFPFMPLDVRRLLSSETWILGTGDERAAAMCLWLESWHQIPAGSLPDNDRMLAHLSQCVKWGKVKEQALRGWIKCSDGRLYHKVVAEKALEAWIEKLLNSISGATGNAKRWDIEIDISEFKADLIRSVELLRDIAPQSKALKKSSVLKIMTGSAGDKIKRENISTELSPHDPEQIAPRLLHDSAEDRNRQGQGQGLSIPASAGIEGVKRRSTRKCPPDFEITPEMRTWGAANAGLANLDAATDAFRDHTFKNAISDWVGAWRNWMRRDHQYAQEKQKGPPRRAPVRENFDAINYGEGISPL